MEEIKLKPCRDCGGEAEIHVIKENGEFALSIHVRCTKCERRIMSVVLVKFSLFTYSFISSFGIFIVEKPP